MTPFAALLAASGLSQREAMLLFNIKDKTTISQFCKFDGRYKAKPDQLKMLSEIVNNNLDKADILVEVIISNIEKFGRGRIEISISNDDYEAQQNGFPYLSSEKACLGVALAQLDDEIFQQVRILPRGSTIALAAAEKQQKAPANRRRLA